MSDDDDDDDDTDYELWMEMSEAEQEQEFQAALRAYGSALAQLTPKQLYAYRRQSGVRRCLRWRKLCREFDLSIMRDSLRKTQLMLLELRIEHYTGATVGRA